MSFLRYYITDRAQLKGGLNALLPSIERAVQTGVEYIQIREKDLSSQVLLSLSREALNLARGTATKLLINGRVDIALACGLHGVHLPSHSISPEDWRHVLPQTFLLAVSCHSVAEVQQAQAADLIVFGPVFPSPGKGPPTGVEELGRAAHSSRKPVLALGGIDSENQDLCLAHGAAGIAAIRMFQY